MEREHTQLHPYVPLSPALDALHSLLQRRATVVKATTQLRLSFNSLPSELPRATKQLGLTREFKALLRSHEQMLKAIDRQIEQLLAHEECREAATRLRSIKGIGLLSGAALLVALRRGQFAKSD